MITSTYAMPIGQSFDFGDGTVTQIEEDWTGLIWIATTNGLFRFDGTEVRKYGDVGENAILPHSLIYSILIDSIRRCIWVGTRGGLARFHPATEETEIFKTDYQSGNKLADNLVRKVIQDAKGRIWVSCFNRGLSLYQDETNDFRNYFFDLPDVEALHELNPKVNLSALNSFTTMCRDDLNANVLWLGGPLGLVRFNSKGDGHFRWMDVPGSTLEHKVSRDAVVELFSLGKQLIVGQIGGVYILDTDSEEISYLNVWHDSDNKLVRPTKMIEQEWGTVYISFRNGLMSIDLQQQKRLDSWLDDPKTSQYYGLQLYDSRGQSWIYSSGQLELNESLKYYARGYPIDVKNTT